MEMIIKDKAFEAENQKLLIVDDSPHNLDLLVNILQGAYEIEVATNGLDALKQVEKDSPDLILLDIGLPDINGYEVCRKLKSDPDTKEIPVIFISSRSSTDAQLEGFNVGGVDYILKPFNSRIIDARVKTHLELKRLRDYFKSLSRIDGLTQIPNRRFFMDKFSKSWMKALESKEIIIVGMLDIDNFKNYNDNYGHTNGDECLKSIAKALYKVSLKYKIDVARYGGEEFIFFSVNKSLNEMINIIKTMINDIKRLRIVHEHSSVSSIVTVSIGLAQEVPIDNNFTNIIKLADRKLYEAKVSGRNQFRY
ncbi:cyclic-di-GMP-producing response regulator Rrp1 [Borreliella burgdorferi]|nr:cyclic-di-GMP-producing response regulator Rrp1 [Borreliella burgdorferi]EEH31674.1 response regulatory protein [Borreliella burgdorferi Bol26]MCD2379959.1 cyclic-di-GMP-producing response regulator Rrp1 [Borreliella burgdorferi]MCS2181549.1 cyclic-di-GMP-producing response regulator Rrp1 [Borreliella burgdorferi]PRR00118.1 diguanylate cyclase response regulator [Borreliella burgdorferi]PRR17863.1 diguanylate cyclase response regulator [Borreliella burgdorferi]